MEFKLLAGSSGSSDGLMQKGAEVIMRGEKGCFPSLTVKQRLIGCATCFGLGLVTSVISALFLLSTVTFATMYTLGNMLSLFGTGFLVGPGRQVRNMFHRKRVTASVIYLSSLGATLGVAFGLGSVLLVLLMMGIQFLALSWYTLSYVPYARDLIKRSCFRRTGVWKK